jgi:tRNA G18 (ribose-2'-O)-methylase SpoU
MGAVFNLPWTRVGPWPAGVDQLQDAGFVVAALTLADDAVSLDDFAAQSHSRLALVMGTEGHGLHESTAERCDARVRIPMKAGIDSLNVAAASAVAFYATRPRPG